MIFNIILQFLILKIKRNILGIKIGIPVALKKNNIYSYIQVDSFYKFKFDIPATLGQQSGL